MVKVVRPQQANFHARKAFKLKVSLWLTPHLSLLTKLLKFQKAENLNGRNLILSHFTSQKFSPFFPFNLLSTLLKINFLKGGVKNFCLFPCFYFNWFRFSINVKKIRARHGKICGKVITFSLFPWKKIIIKY